MQATTSTCDPLDGVSSLAPDDERAEFYRLGLAGNHDEVRRRLTEAGEGMRRRIAARLLLRHLTAAT